MLCFHNSLLESDTLLELTLVVSWNWTEWGLGPKWLIFRYIRLRNLRMRMKSRHSGNLCNDVFCSLSLWTGFQRSKLQGTNSNLLAPHPSSQSRADRGYKVVRAFWFLSSTEPSCWAFLLLVVPVSLGAKSPFSKARHVLQHRGPSLGWAKPRMRWWPEVVIQLWVQRGSASSALTLTPLVGQGWCSAHTNFLSETTWVYRKPPGTKSAVFRLVTQLGKICCAMFCYWFSFSWCSIFNLNGSRLRHRMGKNVPSYTTGKRAWFSDFVSMLSN